jgi:hypothetical protein
MSADIEALAKVAYELQAARNRALFFLDAQRRS